MTTDAISLPALTTTTLLLEADQDRLGWDRPARLFGIQPDLTWIQVDEGEPYDLVELFTLLPGEDFVAVTLVVEGWASPPGSRRPSRHPQRRRVRTTVSVARDGRYVAVLRPAGGPPEIMPTGSGDRGALMEALLRLWDRVAAVEN